MTTSAFFTLRFDYVKKIYMTDSMKIAFVIFFLKKLHKQLNKIIFATEIRKSDKP